MLKLIATRHRPVHRSSSASNFARLLAAINGVHKDINKRAYVAPHATVTRSALTLDKMPSRVRRVSLKLLSTPAKFCDRLTVSELQVRVGIRQKINNFVVEMRSSPPEVDRVLSPSRCACAKCQL